MDIQIKKRFSADVEEIDSEFVPMISENDEDQYLQQTDLPDTLPILPLRNMVLFPSVVMPVTIGRSKSLRLVRETYQKESLMAVFTQIDSAENDPGASDMHLSLIHISE